MATTLNIGQLRQLIDSSKLGWKIDDRLKDTDALTVRPLGCDLTKVPKATEIPRTDLTPFLSADSNNPFLRELRIQRGFLKANTLPKELLDRATGPATALLGAGPAAPVTPVSFGGPAPAAGGGASTAVDWRNRFTWNWLTDIKDQGGCESCWVFSAVGVVEAMARIEHTIWSLRSEGDVHDGLGVSCAQTGGPATAFDWMKGHGVADPGCWAYEQSNLPYAPTADRSGRTVKLDSYVTINNAADAKNWIDTVGPISACFTCYYDFMAYGPNSGVYQCNPASGVAGGHCIVIVGYDDSKQAWLVRNSWGTNHGMAGYYWYHYGDGSHDYDFEHWTMYGVPGASTNPDPWTKRRAHNGSLYESGNGTNHRNFELWTRGPGDQIRHYWRDGGTNNWAVAETQANNCASNPTVTGTTYNRNFEMVYQTTGGRMQHLYFDQGTGHWNFGPIFGPTNTAGVPGFIQGDYGAPGNFELVVRTADGKLAHWWRNEANGEWSQSATFGANVALSAPTLVQRWDRGLDVIVVNNDGSMQRYWRDDAHGGAWAAAERFGSGVTTVPMMIESQFGASDEKTPGNYELCVAVGGAVQHWWRPYAGSTWSMSTTFGANVKQVVGMIESSYGFDLEVIVELYDGSLQHYWRNNTWHFGAAIAGATLQAGWRWCHKCQGMFFGDNSSKGTCPADGAPHDGSTSGRYAAIFGEDAPGQQGNWRWCHKCQGMFFGGNPSKGTCPTDHQPHDPSQSGHYATRMADDAPGQQGNWRWCFKCQGMFFNGNTSKGTCPADHQPHNAAESGHYAELFTPVG